MAPALKPLAGHHPQYREQPQAGPVISNHVASWTGWPPPRLTNGVRNGGSAPPGPRGPRTRHLRAGVWSGRRWRVAARWITRAGHIAGQRPAYWRWVQV